MGGYLSLSVPFHQGSLTEKTSNQASSPEGDHSVFAGIMETEIKAMTSLSFFLSVVFLVLKRDCAEITFPHCCGTCLVLHGGACSALPCVGSAALCVSSVAF